jgi:hypothetical protein
MPEGRCVPILKRNHDPLIWYVSGHLQLNQSTQFWHCHCRAQARLMHCPHNSCRMSCWSADSVIVSPREQR